MTGTWVNFFGIIAGSLLGLLLKKRLPQRVSEPILKIEGVAILIIALNGLITTMFTVDLETGRLSDQGGLLLLVSLVLGCLVGELLRIDDRLNQFGLLVERRLGAEGFAKGFVTSSLIFCVGAMAIIGPLNDGLSGDSGILFIKTALDGTTALLLSSVLGIGVLFSAVPVLLIQGTVALLATQISVYVSDPLLDLFCMVGYAIVFCIGLNFITEAKIKTANLLPSLIVPIVYYFVWAA